MHWLVPATLPTCARLLCMCLYRYGDWLIDMETKILCRSPSWGMSLVRESLEIHLHQDVLNWKERTHLTPARRVGQLGDEKSLIRCRSVARVAGMADARQRVSINLWSTELLLSRRETHWIFKKQTPLRTHTPKHPSVHTHPITYADPPSKIQVPKYLFRS